LRGFIPPEFSGGAGQLQRTEILVVGAGPAGLTTAYMLAKAGRDVTVIERDPIYVGGISRTVNYKGFLFDIGGHRLFSKSKEVVALWEKSSPMISSSGGASHAYSIAASSILSAESVRGAAQSRASAERCLHGVLCLGQSLPRQKTQNLSRLGAQPVR
jgi:uncharacterized protein with NAD-binding domain and iron-sulfur cluster